MVDLAILEQLLQPRDLDVDDASHLLALEPMEQDDLVHAIEKFRAEACAHHAHDLIPDRVGILALGLVHQIVGAEVRGHHDQGIPEIDRVALAVRQTPVVEHLQQHVEHVRMRLLDLVEQHDLVRPPPHGFRKRSALVIADIAGRRADQPRDRMLLHVFRHVHADQRAFIVKQECRERLGQARSCRRRWGPGT